ncbi:MAG: uncharacterized protein H6R26_926 [Proteobacteria bacterium]|nr:uncharacterized protein [Pseudomonadota bacterium]
MSIKSLPAFLASLLISASSPAALADESKPEGMTRTMLMEQQIDLPSPKLKTNVLRVTLPQGFKTPLHTHEGPGPRYVLKGQIRMEEGGQSHVYGPGDVFWETGQWMTVENVGQGDAEMVIIELTNPR